MTEETENMVLELLRRMRTSLERMELDMQDIKSRMTGIEITSGQMSGLFYISCMLPVTGFGKPDVLSNKQVGHFIKRPESF